MYVSGLTFKQFEVKKTPKRIEGFW